MEFTLVEVADESLNVRVEGVKVSNFSSGIKLAGFYNLLTDSSKILNSIIDSCQEGIYVDLNIVEIKNNVVTASDNTMYMGIGSRCDIHDNIFISAPYISTFFTTMYSSFGYPSKIYNNIIVSIYETDITNSCRGFSVGPQSISNNLFMGITGLQLEQMVDLRIIVISSTTIFQAVDIMDFTEIRHYGLTTFGIMETIIVFGTALQ